MINTSEIQQRMERGLCARPDCAGKADHTIHPTNTLCALHWGDARLAARSKGRMNAYGVDHWSIDQCCDCGAPRPYGAPARAGLYQCPACTQAAQAKAPPSGPAPAHTGQGSVTPVWHKGRNVKVAEKDCDRCGAPIDLRKNPSGRVYPADRGEHAPHRCSAHKSKAPAGGAP
jgi:hypothetical protein